MIDKPMLYTAENVRALLRDVDPKTQTRRIAKENIELRERTLDTCKVGDPPNIEPCFVDKWGYCTVRENLHLAPHPVGSRAWVKETFSRVHPGLQQHLDPDPNSPHWSIVYRADMDDLEDQAHRQFFDWTPSIHMPRRFSRITLEIIAVRVERLQDITENDARAEGVEVIESVRNANDDDYQWRDYCRPAGCSVQSAIDSYKSLWESIHGKGSWAKNPYVWVYTFRRVKP